ncbi:integral membrane [Pyrenophora seminiperda CCB06]|uniref:Integral membrane n=1 Tax=Pyrenophora seminiperda CCB06 TaxID=1302712 RepID=A0A3M7M737_9PLEO|nr:integral membrane [Pyrenophora seminiperda CCB06]
MRNRPGVVIAARALLLELLPLVAAHGHGDGMDMSVHDTPPAHSQDNGFGGYWSLSEHASLMYWHIGLEILAWVVILPVAVMFSVARSHFTPPTQLAFLATNALALLFGIIYDHKTPEMYAGNAHNKTGWAITWIASAWVSLALVQAYARKSNVQSIEDGCAEPMTTVNMLRFQRVHNSEPSDPSRWSDDSGHGTERNSLSLHDGFHSPSAESESQFVNPSRRFTHDDDDSFDDSDDEKRGFLRNTSMDKFFSRNVARFAVGRTLKTIRILYVVVERTILVQGFVAIVSGAVVYGGIGRGGAIFNVLAHTVKGGIFFLYGFLTLGRWMGAFADFGWAWNVKPPKEVVGRRRAALPSAEFTESFVIWLYGFTNVFLEHLAAWGGAWTAQDLEHVSISIMFFGGGLLGMCIESTKVRDLLNSGVVASQAASVQHESWQQPRQYRFSMNPLPALIIMLLGKMMSAHHQDSMVSTMIHSQWGSMFMGFALARGVTYITLYISPPMSFLPSRPPTEIVAAFCLIAGGITFMVSNKDTVAALESYNLDAMFIFTVVMGLTALLMAWTTVLFAIKGWALRKETKTQYMKSPVGTLA